MRFHNIVIPIETESAWAVADSKCYTVCLVGEDVWVGRYPPLETGSIGPFGHLTPSGQEYPCPFDTFLRIRNLNRALQKWKQGGSLTDLTECLIVHVHEPKVRTYLGVYAEWEKIKKRVSEDPEALNDIVDELDENRYATP